MTGDGGENPLAGHDADQPAHERVESLGEIGDLFGHSVRPEAQLRRLLRIYTRDPLPDQAQRLQSQPDGWQHTDAEQGQQNVQRDRPVISQVCGAFVLRLPAQGRPANRVLPGVNDREYSPTSLVASRGRQPRFGARPERGKSL